MIRVRILRLHKVKQATTANQKKLSEKIVERKAIKKIFSENFYIFN